MAQKEETQKTGQDLQPKENIGYLFLIQPYEKEGYYFSIDSDCIKTIKEQVKDAKADNLYFVINSPGGDTYSAVKIIRLLRTKFKKVIGVVPSKAMSAATLMLLGTDEIVMSPESQLGPLDLPMEHPSDGTIISALDVINSLSNISSAVSSTAISWTEEIRGQGSNRLGKKESAKIAFSNAAEMVKPITEKLDPYLLSKSYRELLIGYSYARDLLRTGMMKGRDKTAGGTARKFVYSYPAHGYAIFREEAKDILRLNISESEKFPIWDDICTKFELLFSSGTKKTILYTENI